MIPDRESDDLDDAVGLGGSDAALGWANEGSLLFLGIGNADEAEPALS